MLLVRWQWQKGKGQNIQQVYFSLYSFCHCCNSIPRGCTVRTVCWVGTYNCTVPAQWRLVALDTIIVLPSFLTYLLTYSLKVTIGKKTWECPGIWQLFGKCREKNLVSKTGVLLTTRLGQHECSVIITWVFRISSINCIIVWMVQDCVVFSVVIAVIFCYMDVETTGWEALLCYEEAENGIELHSDSRVVILLSTSTSRLYRVGQKTAHDFLCNNFAYSQSFFIIFGTYTQ